MSNPCVSASCMHVILCATCAANSQRPLHVRVQAKAFEVLLLLEKALIAFQGLMAGCIGGPLLAALVSGEAAEAIEKQPAGDTVAEALAVLRGIFGPQGITVPTPLQVASCSACFGSPTHAI